MKQVAWGCFVLIKDLDESSNIPILESASLQLDLMLAMKLGRAGAPMLQMWKLTLSRRCRTGVRAELNELYMRY